MSAPGASAPCTTCGAFAGEPCVDAGGEPTPGRYHRARIDRAAAEPERPALVLTSEAA